MRKITPRIERAIDVFLDALNNGTLAKGDCSRCAVGSLLGTRLWGIDFGTNLLGHQREKIYQEGNLAISSSSARDLGFRLPPDTPLIEVRLRSLRYQAEELLSKMYEQSDFTRDELMKIEKVFEKHTRIYGFSYYKHSKEAVRADQIRGLKAVVEVMLEFDEVEEDVHEIFTNKAEVIPV